MLRRRTAGGLLVVTALGAAMMTPASAAPPTLVNAGLEKSSGGVPTCFSRSGSGTAKVRWALTGSARSGKAAQSVTVSSYKRGAWQLLPTLSARCAPAVTPGATYTVSLAYRSTARSNKLRVYRHSKAGWTLWRELRSFGASSGWRTASATTPAVPAGTDQISFGLAIAGNGTLVTDDYGLRMARAPEPTGGELTYNGGLEAGSTVPTGWRVDATNKTAGSVVKGAFVAGRSSARAYAVTVSRETTGDVKLLPTDDRAPAVQPGESYTLSAWYRSTSRRLGVTIFAHTADGWGYWTDLGAVPASSSWRRHQVQTPPIPAGVDAIAWGISMVGNGTVTLDDHSTRRVVTAPPITGRPEVNGQWEVTDYQMPIRAMHSTVLKTGKVLLIAGSGSDAASFAAQSFKASIWDPVAETFTTLDVPEDMFCAGHVTLADGKVLIQGGTKTYPVVAGSTDYGGLESSYLFDPETNTFTKVADALDGHWYPTLTQLGNGDVWMAGGLKANTEGSVVTEYWDDTAKTWLPEVNAQAAQTYAFWGLYPHMFLMDDGRLFYSGGHVFGDARPGSAGGASIYSIKSGAIRDVAGLRQKDYRDQSASVLLPPAQTQKVLITGGGNINRNQPAIRLTDIIDLNAARPAYRPGPDLPGLGKMYLNATTLPDRTVLVTNGSRFNRDDASNVRTAAVYDPARNAWTSVAADPIGRNYHSTAVLLPDGRVGVLGSNPGDGSYEFRVSIYSPSYLFKGERPTVGAVPAAATYGGSFSFPVTTAPGTTVRWAQLTRPMSVTHQMDSNMRLVDLPVTVAGGVATVTVPANRNLLPPGPYMLTITDSKGVPSTSQWVTVQ